MRAKSSNHIDYQCIPRSIGAMGKDYPDGYVSRSHSHPRAQFLYATAGVMEVQTPGTLWVVPPQRALWIPAETIHETRMRGNVTLRTLYVDTAHCALDAPERPTAIRVSPLLRELVIRAVEMPLEYGLEGRDDLVIQLILHEIDWGGRPQFSIARPQDPRLRRIFDGVHNAPADERSLQEWANAVGASTRTLVRLFKAELGLSFRDWRQQMRLLAAIPLLAAGTPITKVAGDVGYDTPSAFSLMFRRIMGMTPRQYLSHR
jgi:AraC-like DNA-binding protein